MLFAPKFCISCKMLFGICSHPKSSENKRLGRILGGGKPSLLWDKIENRMSTDGLKPLTI